MLYILIAYYDYPKITKVQLLFHHFFLAKQSIFQTSNCPTSFLPPTSRKITSQPESWCNLYHTDCIYTIEYNKNKNKATHQIVLQTQWLTIAKHSSSFTNHDIWISSQSNFLSRIYHDLCILRLIINQATIVKYNYISKTHKPSMSMRILQVMDTHRRSTKLAFFNIDNLPSLGSWN